MITGHHRLQEVQRETPHQPQSCEQSSRLNNVVHSHSLLNPELNSVPMSETNHLNNHHFHTVHDTEKMEAATQKTASTYSSDAKVEEDDNTTIKSMDDANMLDSPALLGMQAALPEHSNLAHHGLLTPSTISTTASTDEASIENPLQLASRHHRRGLSWDTSNLDANASTWGYSQRVASFRENSEGFPPIAPAENRWQNHPPRINPELPYLPGNTNSALRIPAAPRQPQPGSVQTFRSYQSPTTAPHQRRPAGYPPQGNAFTHPQVINTPPRPPRSNVPSGPTPMSLQGRPLSSSAGVPVSNPSTQSHGGSRSSAEVLKTLLRKKACLYEPDTSRAVALITWLVGRELALEYGFFSRQQLQAGVHACVASKIDTGEITRTKVNRCMQIILNSCFHYIIPRPDGTEENGDAFRAVFVREMSDDSYLLADLPQPWNDIRIDRLSVLAASLEELEKKGIKKPPNVVESTPPPSPRFGSVASPGSPTGKESIGEDSLDGKRAVLLCFNENVRSAEDVFRCHNEFIRDTAHASNLQLSSSEWRQFFGRKAADTPHLWGNIGIPVPFNEAHHGNTDALGMMSTREMEKFRTSWCTKRYDHDHTLCGFAHVEVNGGWLRRDPVIVRYKDEMCPHVSVISGKNETDTLLLNACLYGVNCEMCHSLEEFLYHPSQYKINLCARLNGCSKGDACPHFHPVDTYRFPRKSDHRTSRNRPSAQDSSKQTQAPVIPEGSPVLYVNPAPASSFERHLLMPGLQSLFRRQCAVVREHMQGNSESNSFYSYFGDATNVRTTPKKPMTDRWLND